MKKREGRKINIIALISVVFLAIIFILFVFIKSSSEKAKDIRPELKGELATLKPGEIPVSWGLVAYYKFDGNANDAIGSHHGVVYGASLKTGVYGQAYEFKSISKGSEDYINIPFKRGDALDFSNKQKITTSFWMNLYKIPSDNNEGSRPLYWEDYPVYDGNERIEWFVTDNKDGTYTINWILMNQSAYGIPASICYKTIPYNEWHMFTGTYDGSVSEIYIDGESCGAALIPGAIYPTSSGDGWIISDATPDKKRGIVGKIDELRIYNRSLTSAEIVRLFLWDIDASVSRDVTYSGRYNVKLSVSRSKLIDSEIMIITEKIPDGTSVVQSSWNIEPTYNFGNILVWVFANKPPQKLGTKDITQQIPATITYDVTGTSSGTFRGKWGLEKAYLEGVITGKNTL